MSAWIDRILQGFPADLSRLWIASDPDQVLLDERILAELKGRGFDLLPFEVNKCKTLTVGHSF